MLTIKFTKDADPVSDYEVEEFYQTFKNSTTLMICNNLVLQRFRVAVHEGEIEKFTLFVENEDGDFKGCVFERLESNANNNILYLNDSYLDRLLDL